MLFNRLVKYESSIGGVSLKAILSDNDGKSSSSLGNLHYSKYLGNPTADAYTVTLNLNLREENSEKFLISYEIR